MMRFSYVRFLCKFAVFLLFFCFLPGTGHSADVNLSWDQPANSSPIAGYRIYYGASGTDYKVAPMLTVNSASQTSVLISGLEEGQIYGFAATSFDADGNESAFSSDLFYNVPVSKVPGEIIIDNGGQGTSSTGTWSNSSGLNYYGSTSLWNQTVGGTYTYSAAASGSYEVSAWWTEYQTRSNNVPIQIYDGQQLLDTVYVDQTQNGGKWNNLGTYKFSSEARVVILSESSSYSTCADAVKFVPVEVTDTDGDGLSDDDEINIYGTDPDIADTDGDGISDGQEVAYWGSNWSTDSDGDGIINILDKDSDNDGVSDGQEISQGLDPSTPDNDSSPPSNNTPIIIDNGDTETSSTGTWSNSSGLNYYGNRSLWSQTVGETYTYSAAISGSHEVSVWWTEYRTRSNNVPIEIYDGQQLLDTVYVDQTQNGGKWNVIGTYSFTGRARVVVVSESDSFSTCADAVQFAPKTQVSGPVIIDNEDLGTSSTGTWSNSSGLNYYGSTSLWSQTVGETYTYSAAISGSYEVSVWWTEYQTRSNNVPIEIYDGQQLLDTVYVDQTQNGGKWNVIGIYSFTGQARVVVLSESNSFSTCADAVQFAPKTQIYSPVIIDNGDPETSSTGTWSNSNGLNYYGNTSLWSQTVGETYTYSGAISGSYEVSVWWTEYQTRNNNVPIEIYDGQQLLDSVYVDQTQNGGKWNLLGTYVFSSQARVVIVSESTRYSTCADAIKFAPAAR